MNPREGVVSAGSLLKESDALPPASTQSAIPATIIHPGRNERELIASDREMPRR